MLQYLREIQEQCKEDSDRWFPTTTMSLPFQMLALGGEVGELQNLMKKVIRGSHDMDEAMLQEMTHETVDVFIYLCNVANALGIDLTEAYRQKREFNDDRFTVAGD